MTARLVDCPNGHRVKPVPVLYGMPTREAEADARDGAIVLGGCDPTFEDQRVGDCPVCGTPISREAVLAARARASRGT